MNGKTGVFTVPSDRTYLLLFTAKANTETETIVELRQNEEIIVASATHLAVGQQKASGDHSIALESRVNLKEGDEIDVFLQEGELEGKLMFVGLDLPKQYGAAGVSER